MPVTRLSDVIVPELFTPYVVNRTMELSALFQSGIITNNAEFDRLASEAAPIHQMPFFEDLSGDSEDIIEDADLTAKKDLIQQGRIDNDPPGEHVGGYGLIRSACRQRPDGSYR